MKQQYNSPILLVKDLNEADILTESVQDDAEGFSFAWIQG